MEIKRRNIIGAVILNVIIWAFVAQAAHGIGEKSGMRKSIMYLFSEMRAELSPECYEQVQVLFNVQE